MNVKYDLKIGDLEIPISIKKAFDDKHVSLKTGAENYRGEIKPIRYMRVIPKDEVLK